MSLMAFLGFSDLFANRQEIEEKWRRALKSSGRIQNDHAAKDRARATADEAV